MAGLPLKQGLAVTGSVNQKGEVQPIGGVNQKIEGFFDLCKAVGLTGEQGVMIPRLNVRNLMLRDDVVEAVRGGSFRIYEVGSIGEGMSLLTGLPAGERDAEGNYPEGTVDYLVDGQLKEYSEALRTFGRRDGETPSDGDKGNGDPTPSS